MELTKKAFKAYDVRGVVPTEVNAEMAYRVGRVFAAMFAAEKVVSGMIYAWRARAGRCFDGRAAARRQ